MSNTNSISSGEKYSNPKELQKREKQLKRLQRKLSHRDNKTCLTSDLSVRNWIFENCGNENDRDINASINIMFEGLKIHYQN